jgi:hypothetical protein
VNNTGVKLPLSAINAPLFTLRDSLLFSQSWFEVFFSIFKLIRYIIDARKINKYRVDGDQRQQAKFNPSGGLIQ